MALSAEVYLTIPTAEAIAESIPGVRVMVSLAGFEVFAEPKRRPRFFNPDAQPIEVEVIASVAPRSIGEALPIKGGVIVSGAAIETANARDLHAFLEVGTRFNDWIARRIGEFGFVDGADFLSYSNLSAVEKEYALTLDMAKELAMVERNAKGKEARQYFIKCERDLKAKIAVDKKVPRGDGRNLRGTEEGCRRSRQRPV